MFLITWVFHKLGYMPKVSIDTSWTFPVKSDTQVTKAVKKPSVKKATTRKKPK